MVSIFVASVSGYSGKTFLSLGLCRRLMDEGYRVGYMKPVGKTPVNREGGVFDADAAFVRETLSLHEPLGLVSPLVLDYEKQCLTYEGKIKSAKKRIMDSFKAIKKDKDAVVVEGAGDLFEGSGLGVSAVGLIKAMDARCLLVSDWRGEDTCDTLLGVSRLVGKRSMGVVLNKVPVELMSHARGVLVPFLEKKGLKVFGLFPRDNFLGAVTVRRLNEILGGKVLCAEDRLDEMVEGFLIGAMDVDSALSYFRKTPNKAVITGANRADIQLAAMETSTKCIILTGGLYTNDVVIGRAVSKGIPVISVPEDTFSTIEIIEAAVGKTSLSGSAKAGRAREVMDEGFDMKRFMKAAGLK